MVDVGGGFGLPAVVGSDDLEGDHAIQAHRCFIDITHDAPPIRWSPKLMQGGGTAMRTFAWSGDESRAYGQLAHHLRFQQSPRFAFDVSRCHLRWLHFSPPGAARETRDYRPRTGR